MGRLLAPEYFQVIYHELHEFLGVQGMVIDDERVKALDPELLALLVPHFGDAVGEQYHHIAGMQLHPGLLVFKILLYADGNAVQLGDGAGIHGCPVAEQGTMPGV